MRVNEGGKEGKGKYCEIQISLKENGSIVFAAMRRNLGCLFQRKREREFRGKVRQRVEIYMPPKKKSKTARPQPIVKSDGVDEYVSLAISNIPRYFDDHAVVYLFQGRQIPYCTIWGKASSLLPGEERESEKNPAAQQKIHHDQGGFGAFDRKLSHGSFVLVCVPRSDAINYCAEASLERKSGSNNDDTVLKKDETPKRKTKAKNGKKVKKEEVMDDDSSDSIAKSSDNEERKDGDVDAAGKDGSVSVVKVRVKEYLLRFDLLPFDLRDYCCGEIQEDEKAVVRPSRGNEGAEGAEGQFLEEENRNNEKVETVQKKFPKDACKKCGSTAHLTRHCQGEKSDALHSSHQEVDEKKKKQQVPSHDPFPMTECIKTCYDLLRKALQEERKIHGERVASPCVEKASFTAELCTNIRLMCEDELELHKTKKECMEFCEESLLPLVTDCTDGFAEEADIALTSSKKKVRVYRYREGSVPWTQRDNLLDSVQHHQKEESKTTARKMVEAPSPFSKNEFLKTGLPKDACKKCGSVKHLTRHCPAGGRKINPKESQVDDRIQSSLSSAVGSKRKRIESNPEDSDVVEPPRKKTEAIAPNKLEAKPTAATAPKAKIVKSGDACKHCGSEEHLSRQCPSKKKT